MSGAQRAWTADEFLATDQDDFGDAWRYELVDGAVVALAAPGPEHATILAGLIAAAATRLRGRKDGARPEAGSGAISRTRQRNTARIPDAMVRCGEHPRVLFEVVSPSDIEAWRARDRRAADGTGRSPGVDIGRPVMGNSRHDTRPGGRLVRAV